MEYFKTEVKTGAVILISLALLIMLIVGISGTKTMGRTYNYTVLFKNVSSLDTDAPVNYSGFEVGKVKGIRLTSKKEREKHPEYNIAVKITLNSLATVREDSIIQIKTLGYLGLKYLDITVGDPSSKEIKPGSTILGFTPQDINEIIEMVGSIIKEINPKVQRILDGIEKIVGPQGTLTVAIAELKAFVTNANEVVVVNRDDIRALIANLSATSENLKNFSADIEEHPWKLLIKSKSKKEEQAEIQRTRDTSNVRPSRGIGSR